MHDADSWVVAISNRFDPHLALEDRVRVIQDPVDTAEKHQQAALEEISLFVSETSNKADAVELEAWKANIKNDIGWIYVKNNRSREAIQPLEEARQSDEARSSPTERCKKADRDNQRLGSVYQNLADAYLAQGAYPNALKFAILSQLCREWLASLSSAGNNQSFAGRKELLEAMKTRAFVLLALERVDEAREYAIKFEKGFAELVDDKIIPNEYLIQVVGGQRVSLNKIVTPAEMSSDDSRNDSKTPPINTETTSPQKGK